MLRILTSTHHHGKATKQHDDDLLSFVPLLVCRRQTTTTQFADYYYDKDITEFKTMTTTTRLATGILALFVVASQVGAFSTAPGFGVRVSQQQLQQQQQNTCLLSATATPDAAEAGAPPATSEASTDMSDAEIPTNLPSDCGMDYIPLATMLATGQLAEADQFTRDALIEISGAKEKGRDFVYFTDVKNIPSTDLATIERLWNKFSGGKFGYSVQKKKFSVSKGDFEVFCKKVGWTTMDGEVERKKRWFGASEFVYDVKKAKEGHLPLTSALRGTSLFKNLMEHPVWENDDWKKEP